MKDFKRFKSWRLFKVLDLFIEGTKHSENQAMKIPVLSASQWVESFGSHSYV